MQHLAVGIGFERSDLGPRSRFFPTLAIIVEQSPAEKVLDTLYRILNTLWGSISSINYPSRKDSCALDEVPSVVAYLAFYPSIEFSSRCIVFEASGSCLPLCK